MHTKKVFLIIGLVFMILSMLIAAGSALGQDDNPPPREPQREGSAEPEYILAQPPYTMNYQGYLTDGSGSPLNGSYDLVFSLYDQALDGTMEWGPETHSDVPVTQGLFQVVLGAGVILQPNDFDEALFLDVQIDGTPITPRQPLHAVPYAFGLVPGAEVQGVPEVTHYGLSVNNEGTDDSDRGIYAAGQQYGLYAEEVGDGNVGIYTPDFVKASGFSSTEDSFWWYDANGLQSEDTVSSEGFFSIRNSYLGGVRLVCGATGDDYFVLPMDVPGQLFGQNVRVEAVTVYYQTSNSGSSIARSWVYKSTGAGLGDYEQIAYNNTIQSSTTATSYSIPINYDSGYTLTSTSGNLNAVFQLDCGGVDHVIYLSGVRLRLGHSDE